MVQKIKSLVVLVDQVAVVLCQLVQVVLELHHQFKVLMVALVAVEPIKALAAVVVLVQ
jgi:hypothetical protein